jgi:hypothetical protein
MVNNFRRFVTFDRWQHTNMAIHFRRKHVFECLKIPVCLCSTNVWSYVMEFWDVSRKFDETGHYKWETGYHFAMVSTSASYWVHILAKRLAIPIEAFWNTLFWQVLDSTLNDQSYPSYVIHNYDIYHLMLWGHSCWQCITVWTTNQSSVQKNTFWREWGSSGTSFWKDRRATHS